MSIFTGEPLDGRLLKIRRRCNIFKRTGYFVPAKSVDVAFSFFQNNVFSNNAQAFISIVKLASNNSHDKIFIEY